MRKSELLTLFDYNYWSNGRVLHAAERLTDDQYTADAGLSHGSIRGALVHVFAAEHMWRVRCEQGISPSALVGEEAFPTLGGLVERWETEEATMRRYLDTLTDDDLVKPVRYSNTKGKRYENLLWGLLVHVVNHGTQFRSEAAVALTRHGRSPGDLDLLLYLRQIDT